MIPSISSILSMNLKIETQPSKNYKMHTELNKISGTCDKLEAMHQVIYKILNTERYQYIIYSWNYGIELRDLFGQPIPWVYPELERRITEALMWDDRVSSVTEFEFENVKNEVHVSFTVNTIFGSFEENLAVKV